MRVSNPDSFIIIPDPVEHVSHALPCCYYRGAAADIPLWRPLRNRSEEAISLI